MVKNIALNKQFKNHTLDNAVDDLTLEALQDNAIYVHNQPIRYMNVNIQVLDEDSEDILDTIEGRVVSGDVKMEATSLIRRTCNLVVTVDNTLYPSAESLIWFHKKLKVYVALKDSTKIGSEVNFLVGTFFVDSCDFEVNSQASTLSLSLSDKMGQFDNTEVMTPIKLSPDTPVSVAIKMLMENFGEKKFGYIQESKYNEVIPYTIDVKVGDKKLDVITKLRDMYMDYTCGYDINGNFEYKKIDVGNDVKSLEPKWTFNPMLTNQLDLMVDFKETYNLKDIRNRVVVYGKTNEDTGYTPYAEVRLTDPKSPFNIFAIGDRPINVSENDYLIDEQCYAKARYEVLKNSTFQETVDIQTVPIYIFDAFDLIDIVHPFTKETNRYSIKSFSLGLSVDDTMSIQANKIYYAKTEYGEANIPIVNAVVRGIVNNGWISIPEDRIKKCYHMIGNGDALIWVRFTYEEVGGQQASIISYPTTKNQTLLIDIADFQTINQDDENGSAEGRNKGDYLDRVIGHEMFHAVSNDFIGHKTMVQTPIWFKEGFAEFLHGGKDRYLATYKGMSASDKKEKLIARAISNLNGSWEGLSEDYVSAYLIAVAIYRLTKNTIWNNIFQNVREMSNPSINFLIKFLPIADSVNGVIAKIENELRNMNDVWNLLNDTNDLDTMSVGGIHFMNLYGVPLTAESVFNNDDAREESIGFKIQIQK